MRQAFTELHKIYIDSSLEGSLLVSGLEKRIPSSIELEYIQQPGALLEQHRRSGNAANKSQLLISSYRGRFLSGCPGSDGMVCCQYFVINTGPGCLFDCSYCYLQGFLNNPLMVVHGNLEDLFSELDLRTRGKNFHFRIGSGEYSDSLVLEPLTGLSSHLIQYFATHPNATLELKTKSDNVEPLLDLDHGGHTVVAWSLNPPTVVEALEIGCATLEERLIAAAKVRRAGYRLAFHLDPLIYFENWEEEYHRLIERIFDYVDPDGVAWISAGSFRYTAALKEAIQARFPEDRLIRGAEMIQGADGKHRYYKTTRRQMFSSVKKKIESIDPKLFLYLCMETQHTWQELFGFIPTSASNLDALFEERRQYMAQV